MAQAGGGLTRQALQQHLALRAAEDEGFRRELLRDPRGVLERELELLLGADVRLREDLVVRIHEEEPGAFDIVLPSRRDPDAAAPDPDALTFLWQGALMPRE